MTTSPENFKGGGIWNVIVGINDALKAIAYALLVLFFVIGVMKTCGSFTELKRPEVAFKCFIRFVLAQAAVTYGMELMTALFSIAQGAIQTIMGASGLSAMEASTLPAEIASTIEDVGLLESIPLWAVTLLGSLFIWVLSLVMILTVYGRFFKLYMATAIAPIPLSSFAGQPSSSISMAFIKSYAAICLEGCVILLACIIFSQFASSPPVVTEGLAPATVVWNYIGELVFNTLLCEIAGQLYKETNAKTQIAAQIARKRASLMKLQDTFNAAYFSELIDAVSLHVGGGVVLHTKTETDICESEDKPNGSPENSETDSFRN